MNNEKKGYLSTILMSLIMGMQYIFIKDLIKLSNNNVFFVLSVRFFIALLIMMIIFKIKKEKIDLSLKNKDMFKLSFYNPVINFSFQTIGVMLCPVTTVSVLIALIPIANVVVSYFTLKERLSLKQSLFMGICIIGTLIASVSSSAHNDYHFALIGAILIILSIFSRAIYQAKLKQQSKINQSIDKVCFYQIYYGFTIFLIIFLIFTFLSPTTDFISILLTKDFIIGILYLSVLATIGVFYLNNYAVKNISVISIGLMNNITVLVSTLAGVFFLSEKFTLVEAVGIFMILLGSYFYYKDKKQ
ncbi:DMT family transporter [Anaerofustis sp.]|uniref:DMT family transporter n=1 Tax=Anaerofustis sp. TaxID=1872517 RepID=UPI0025BE2949|nr:DMT family transporter [Anaerofustis sp.]